MENSPAAGDIRRIHVIFKTHLDVGFTDFSANVVRNYFTSYIPRAIELAIELRQSRSPYRFTWTTGSWLIYEYLEQAGAKERRAMENAIAAGDITWHALPFTTHSEMLDPSLFRYGLSLSRRLDERFGRRTIAAKMTDVPGHTRGIVPLLAEAGVSFLHIGVNGASTPPDVPPVFNWRDPEGAEVMVMYHKGSYGDLMIVPGLEDAIVFAHTGDNLGPQSAEDLTRTYQEISRRFPGRAVLASTMDAFAANLGKIRGSLPVIEAEIGDTWIHGAGTDPKKVAAYRELCRLRREWLEHGDSPDSLDGFSRKLLLVPEHTWGLDVKTHLGDWENYAAGAFRAARSAENYQKMERSWQEQRAYLSAAVDALPEEKKAEANRRLAALTPSLPAKTAFSPVADLTRPIHLGRFRGVIDPQTGCLTRLELDGRQIAGPGHPLGRFWYQSFSAEDYRRFYRQYNVNKRQNWFWAVPDFTKPGLETSGAESKTFTPHLTWCGQQADGLLLMLEMPPESWQVYGAPKRAAIEISPGEQPGSLSFRLQWFEKPACRLPEALWFSFEPAVGHPHGWKMDKLGRWVSPLEVIRDGSRHLHAAGDGGVQNAEAKIGIRALDSALVAPGQPSLLDFNNRQPNLNRGIHFNLFNNLWGTNFPMWYEEDALFRFALQVD